jgi:hypothetical protein
MEQIDLRGEWRMASLGRHEDDHAIVRFLTREDGAILLQRRLDRRSRIGDTRQRRQPAKIARQRRQRLPDRRVHAVARAQHPHRQPDVPRKLLFRFGSLKDHLVRLHDDDSLLRLLTGQRLRGA